MKLLPQQNRKKTADSLEIFSNTFFLFSLFAPHQSWDIFNEKECYKILHEEYLEHVFLFFAHKKNSQNQIVILRPSSFTRLVRQLLLTWTYKLKTGHLFFINCEEERKKRKKTAKVLLSTSFVFRFISVKVEQSLLEIIARFCVQLLGFWSFFFCANRFCFYP